MKIQKSTRTTIPHLEPAHNFFRMKFGWHYRWHLNRFSDAVRIAVLALYILGLGAGVVASGFATYRTATPVPAKASAAWMDAAWTYRDSITVDHSKVGTGGVTNFPVLLTGANMPAGLWAQAKADGSDLRVTSANGTTEINFELVSFTPGSTTMELWFLAPSLSSDSDSVFYLYWGNAGASAKAAAWGQGVWASYGGVYHLGEASGTLHDSSGHTDGTAQNSPTYGVAGAIAKSLGINGSNQYVSLGTSSPITGNTYSLEAWVNQSSDLSSANSWYSGYAVMKGDDYTQAANDYGLFVSSSDKTVGKLAVGFATGQNTTAPNNLTTALGSIGAGTWTQLVGTINAGNKKVYINGDDSGVTATSTYAIATSGVGLNIGITTRGAPYAYPFRGNVDEVRLVPGAALSAAWVKSEYNNQSSPGTFYAMGLSSISGTITQNGSGLSQVTVTATKGGTTKTTLTASDGTYTIRCDDGTWTVTPTKTNYSFSPSAITPVVSGTDVPGQNFTAAYVPPAFLTGWSYRVPITIDHTKIGAGGVSDFPVLLTEANVPVAFWSQVASDGKDVRLTSDDGTTVLKSEMTSIDTSGHKLEVWWKAPSLSSTADTYGYLYWGNSSATMPIAADQQNVWGNGYAGVWHMNDVTTSTIKDSTTYGNTGNKTGANSPLQADGIFGKAQQFTAGNKINVGSGNSLNLNTEDKTFEGMIYINNIIDGATHQIITRYTSDATTSYEFAFNNGYLYYTDGTNAWVTSSPTNMAIGWHFVGMTFSPSTNAFKFYIDGSDVSDKTLAGDPNSTGAMDVGIGGRANNTWGGSQTGAKFEDVTASSSIRTAPWILTEYNNQNGPSAFYSLGNGEIPTPLPPTNAAISNLGVTSFDTTWTDNSSNETGFKVYISTAANADCSLATYSGTPDFTTAANATGQAVSGKSINFQYCAKIIATNTYGDSTATYAASPKYTLAATPSITTVSGDYSVGSGYHMDVTIDSSSNPAGTSYWIQYSTDGADFSDPPSMAWQTGTTYTLGSLDPNTQYWFKVKAKNGDDIDTTYSASEADVTPPAAPTGLNSSNLCRTTASTSWVASTGADKYTLSYGTDAQATNLGTVTDIAATNKDLTGLTDNTTYYFKVEAVSNTNGTGAYSSADSFSTGSCTAPIAPSDFNGAAASTTQINWSWTDTADDETGWKVEDTSHTDLHDLPVDSTSWNETSLSVNTSYTRHVNVFNANGGNDSNQKTVYTLANVPSAPTVSATSSGIKIVVNTNGNPEAETRYAIYNQTEGKYVKRADGSLQADPDWQLYADWGGASGIINAGLNPNTSYSYQVKAENGDDIATVLSDAASSYSFANVPAAPTVNATSTTSLTVIINQNSNPAGTAYAIYETSASKYVQAGGTLGASAVWQDYTTWGNSSGIVIIGLSINTAYSFHVKARNADGVESSLSSGGSKYTLAAVPSAPTVTTISAGSINIVINANSNPADTTYAIYENSTGKYVQVDGILNGDAVWQNRVTWGGNSGINNSGLVSDTPYTYQVKAKNVDGVETVLSTGAGQTTLPVDHVVLSPNSVSMYTGGTAQFAAVAYDSLDNIVSGLSFTWSVESGGGSISSSGLFTAGSAAGTYSNTVSATTTGITGYASVTISEPPTAPPPEAGVTGESVAGSASKTDLSVPQPKINLPARAVVKTSVQFDVYGSTDNVGITKFSWDFGNGASATGRSVSYTYNEINRYNVTLTVEDKAGNISSTSQSIDIIPPAPKMTGVGTKHTEVTIEGDSYVGTENVITLHSEEEFITTTQTTENGKFKSSFNFAQTGLAYGDHKIVIYAQKKISGTLTLVSDSAQYDAVFNMDNNGDLQVKVDQLQAAHKKLVLIISILSAALIISILSILFLRRRLKFRKTILK